MFDSDGGGAVLRGRRLEADGEKGKFLKATIETDLGRRERHETSLSGRTKMKSQLCHWS